MVQRQFTYKLDDTQIYFTYLNNSTFLNNEIIKFQTSSVNGVSSGVNIGSKEIKAILNLIMDKGSPFDDYSRIVRKFTHQFIRKIVFILHPQDIKTLMMGMILQP